MPIALIGLDAPTGYAASVGFVAFIGLNKLTDIVALIGVAFIYLLLILAMALFGRWFN